jgi:hypothetical protein
MQQAAVVAATAAAATHASATSATATAVTAAEKLHKRVRGSSPQAAAGRRQQRQWRGGWTRWKTKKLYKRRTSVTEADSAGPVKWMVPAWEVLAHDRAGWRGGLKSLRVNECE